MQPPSFGDATAAADADLVQLQWFLLFWSTAIDTPRLEPNAAFLELGLLRFDGTDLNGVLLHVAQLAQRTIPGTADVSVTLVRSQDAFTAAFTGEDALRLDESQYAAGYGPCLDVAQATGVLRIDDMNAEARWPEFTLRALSCGVQSSLSVALPVQESVVGALNLYSHTLRSFDSGAEQLAVTFASYAAVAIANAHLSETNAVLAENMRQAMQTRAVIEQAKGVLIALHGCDDQYAFTLLTQQSQRTNRKLHAVAAEVVKVAQQGPSPAPTP